ncbi:helicase associated domain-containing protein [Streptomyces sp. NPDC086549]|uniref:helicase associated domain-containing protein n=1 Tax=Streptomyces sp. NPDC086549 TaxID=3365752 RepID=UPI003804630E
MSSPARTPLEFSTPLEAAQLAAFIILRVFNPEHAHWRRGIEAAYLYAHELRDLRVPFTYRMPFTYRVPVGPKAAEAGWPAALAGFPLGQWIADARRFHTRGRLDEDRLDEAPLAQLEKPDMVWSHYDTTWEEGLAAAQGWAAEHGHLLALTDTTYRG